MMVINAEKQETIRQDYYRDTQLSIARCGYMFVKVPPLPGNFHLGKYYYRNCVALWGALVGLKTKAAAAASVVLFTVGCDPMTYKCSSASLFFLTKAVQEAISICFGFSARKDDTRKNKKTPGGKKKEKKENKKAKILHGCSCGWLNAFFVFLLLLLNIMTGEIQLD